MRREPARGPTRDGHGGHDPLRQRPARAGGRGGAAHAAPHGSDAAGLLHGRGPESGSDGRAAETEGGMRPSPIASERGVPRRARRDEAAGEEREMAGRKKRPARRITRRWNAVRRWCAARSRGVRIAARARLRPWRPAVEVDVRGRRGRRLRRAITRVTRSHLSALGVTPPAHLLVVVQRTVVLEGQPLAALLQMFEGEGGPRRHLLFLAASAEGRKASCAEVVAALRQQLQRVVAAEARRAGRHGGSAGVRLCGGRELPAAIGAAGADAARGAGVGSGGLRRPQRRLPGRGGPIGGSDDTGNRAHEPR